MLGIFVEREDYNKVITIKLVVTDACNAKCEFCYNRDKVCTCESTGFTENFIGSLDYLINQIGDKNPISVDITGGEPTINIPHIIDVLKKLKEYGVKDKVLRTTLTTNGTNLLPVVPYMEGVIDYVNISIHDYRPEVRKDILGFAIQDLRYETLVKELSKVGITCSASAVIYKPIELYGSPTNDFTWWLNKFIRWSKKIGFIALRLRCDVNLGKRCFFDKYLLETKSNTKDFTVITYEDTTDSHWCRLRVNDNPVQLKDCGGFRVFFLHGVADTSILTKGIEYVIHSDGLAYCDYYKHTKIEDYKYEIGRIYDYTEDEV